MDSLIEVEKFRTRRVYEATIAVHYKFQPILAKYMLLHDYTNQKLNNIQGRNLWKKKLIMSTSSKRCHLTLIGMYS